MDNIKIFWKFMVLLIALIFCFATPTYAKDVTLSWDANAESDLAGYKVYYKTGSSGAPYNGTGATDGNSPIDVGDVTQFTLNGLSDSQTHFFVVTAYNDDGLESGYSNEVNTASSPQPGPPEIKGSLPQDETGIAPDTIPVPDNSSFAIHIEDSEGIDITDTTSVKFTINDGINPTYVLDLSDNTVVRVVKLTSDADTQVTKLWAVYDRSQDDAYGNSYAYDTAINIKVDAKDRTGEWMTQASYDFKIETDTEHVNAITNRPYADESTQAGSTTVTVITTDDLDGFQMVYDSNEPIIPYVESSEVIPLVDISGVTPVGVPVKLGPPTVFNNPVKLIIPCPGQSDVRDLNLYLYDGVEWVYVSSSYNTGGVVQPGGQGWMVPGSLVYHNDTSPPTLEVQVYHFSAIQAGLVADSPSGSSALIGSSSSGGGGGGCFITAATAGTDMEWLLNPIALLLALVLPILTAVYLVRRSPGN